MKRALFYLFIFTTFFWAIAVSLIFHVNPFTSQGETNNSIVVFSLLIIGIAATLLFSLFLSIYKTFLPDQKLPHLLIRDSIIQSSLFGLGITGLIVLQLLRAATLLNIGLWLTIILVIIWIIRTSSAKHDAEEKQSAKHRRIKPISIKRK